MMSILRRAAGQMSGRTVFGKNAARGQEMCDHYMAAMNPHVLDTMNEVMAECYMLGIPLRTRHREVAPNQYEVARAPPLDPPPRPPLLRLHSTVLTLLTHSRSYVRHRESNCSGSDKTLAN